MQRFEYKQVININGVFLGKIAEKILRLALGGWPFPQGFPQEVRVKSAGMDESCTGIRSLRSTLLQRR